MIKPWKTVKKNLVHKNPWWEYRADDVETSDGVTGIYYYHKNNNAVNVFVMRSDGKFVMIREYRHLFKRVSISQVMGGIERGEKPVAAARREIMEEVGCRVKKIIPLGWYATAPSFSMERSHAFLAIGATKARTPNSKGLEVTEPVMMTTEEIDVAIAKGQIWDSQVITTWHLVKQYLAAH